MRDSRICRLRCWQPNLASRAALVGASMAVALPACLNAQPSTPGRLEEVIVTSSIIDMTRRRLATSVSVIGGDDIELRGYSSLADVMRTQPGIGVSNVGGPGKVTSLRIRGEEGYRTLLIIDGVKAVDPSSVQVGPSFDSLLTTSDLSRVEVLRGPQGFIYGADAGGVVNVMTRIGEGALGGRVGFEAGQFGLAKLDASVAGGGDAGDYFVAVTDLETDGFNSQSADTVLTDDDGAQNTTLHAKLGWNATENLRVQLVARDIDATAMFDGCFSSITFAVTHDCLGTTEQTTYKVSAEHRRGGFVNVLGFSKVDILRNSLADGMSSFATQGALSRLEYTGSYSAANAFTLVYGLDLQTEEVTSSELRERDQDGFYVEYQGQFGDRFFLSAGARYDDNDDFGSHTSARLGAAYTQDLGGDTLKYRASYGTGFRPPSLFEIAYNRGPFAFAPAAGVALQEEHSKGYDLGVEYDTAGGLHFEATYFDQEINDEIFFDLAGFSGYLQSLGQSTSSGIELAFATPIGEQWELLANWTYNDTQNTANEQRLRRPKNLANIGAAYTAVSGKLRVVGNYRISRDAIDIDMAALDDYQVLDLSLSYSFNELFEVFGRLENTTDESYQEVIGFNVAGRSAYAGVRLHF